VIHGKPRAVELTGTSHVFERFFTFLFLSLFTFLTFKKTLFTSVVCGTVVRQLT